VFQCAGLGNKVVGAMLQPNDIGSSPTRSNAQLSPTNTPRLRPRQRISAEGELRKMVSNHNVENFEG